MPTDELVVNDRRRFDETGEAREVTEETPQQEFNKRILLAEIPCIYGEPTPIKNYVLIRQNAKETNWGGTKFIIPETAQQNPNKGIVIEVGPEAKSCKRGDIVTFGRFNAEPIDVDGEEFQLVNENDIKLVEGVTYAVNS